MFSTRFRIVIGVSVTLALASESIGYDLRVWGTLVPRLKQNSTPSRLSES